MSDIVTHTARLLVLLSAVIMAGCESLRYYSHVAKGQLQLVSAREPIDELLASASTEPQLKARLQAVQSIRSFASSELGLPDNGSYHDYVALDRPYVVWNVFAAEAFSVDPHQWCFPIAGCVSYRGYFDRQRAERYAQKLQTEGFETYVAGVGAYSTLGWFDDPVLSTFLQRSDIGLAGLLFHELAHQQLYLPGDTAFNESFATAVEQEGLKRWLAAKRQPASALTPYYRKREQQQAFVEMILTLREALAVLYQQGGDESVLRAQKQQLLTRFKTVRYPQFKQRWQTDSYDRWVNSGLNNAKLSTVASYHQWLGAFQQLLFESASLSGFYGAARSLSNQPAEAREQALKALLNRRQQLHLQTL